MAVRNNVTRLLDARKIPYTAYELPTEKHSAVEAAQKIGVDPVLVYKTLVLQRKGPGKAILAVIPGPNKLNLKALARALGEKKIRMTTQKEAEALTGLQTGGISPLALLQRPFQVVLDSTALDHTQIIISGGQRGLNIELPVQALMDLAKASTAQISTR